MSSTKVLKDNIIRIKLISLLVFLIALWVINLLIPMSNITSLIIPELSYISRHLSVLMFMAIIYSISIIKNRTVEIKHTDIILGVTLGALAGAQYPRLLDIVTALTTALAFIAGSIMFNESNTKIPFIKVEKNDTGLIVTIIIILYILFYRLFIQVGRYPVAFGFFRALQPSIWEEVVYRWFLFALCMKITKGEFSGGWNKFIIWLILIVPFILMHQPRYYGGINHAFSYVEIGSLISLIFPATIITLFFLKRDLFSAILIHFILNFYLRTMEYYSGAEILSLLQ